MYSKYTDEALEAVLEDALEGLENLFPILKEHLQRELRKEVFHLTPEEFQIQKTKHTYLESIEVMIKNKGAK